MDFMSVVRARRSVRCFKNDKIPAQHIFLAAVSHGLSACFVGFLDVKKANEILQLPNSMSCLFLLPVGYADETPEDKSLKSIEEITFHNKWQ